MLETNIGGIVRGVTLNTPLLLASGQITETPDFYLRTAPYACAGMVTRSLKENPPPERANTPAPRYVVFDGGRSMLNCEWGNTQPWTTWYDEGIDKVKARGGALILSLSGRDIEDCGHLLRKFSDTNIDAFEINVSCSHSGAVHGNMNTDVTHLRELMQKVGSFTDKPLWIKLSYSNVLLEMAKVAEDFGADAIVCSNSIGPGLFIDTRTGLPKLGIKGGAGGVTGEAIFPIALNCVYQLAQTVRIPIIGSGGISTADHVIQMMMAGASAVQLYTAPHLQGPEIFKKIAEGLVDYLNAYDYDSIEDLIGLSLSKAKENSFYTVQPTFDAAKCTNCGKCSRVCVFDSITDHGPSYDKCVGCNACVGVCPTGALTTKFERR